MKKSKIDKIAFIKQKKKVYTLKENNFFQGHESSNIYFPDQIPIPIQTNDLLLNKFTTAQNQNFTSVKKQNPECESNRIKNISNIVTCYKQKINIKNQNFIPKPNYVKIIPRKIFVCWKTKILPEKMAQNVSQLKTDHPNFEIHVFDDENSVYFLRNYFDEDIVNAFLYLKPGAYKADLFRLCVLYIHGGIYIDIKYRCVNGFRFDYVLDKEYLALDLPCIYWKENTNGIYNGFMVSKPRNPFLFECIQEIVQNVKEKYYGDSSLFPTGPGLLASIYFKDCHSSESCIAKMNEFEAVFHLNLVNIIMQNTVILEIYPEYRTEQKENCVHCNYNQLWKNNDIYNQNIETATFIKDSSSLNQIPLNIFQTWSSMEDIPIEIKKYTEILREQNPEFHYQLYGDKECETFIRDHFEPGVLNAFQKLIPGAYKADLFRYCILFIFGGIYLDIKYYGVNDFKLIYLTDKEYFVRDIESSGSGIYNAFMVAYPGNPILKKAIDQIVENVKTEYYGLNYFCPTGPLLLKPYFESSELALVHREVMDIHQEKKYYISYKNGANLLFYHFKEYRNIQQQETKKHYAYLWLEKAIYDKTSG